MGIWTGIKESYKAWRRGERKVKGAVRGRCFVAKDKDCSEVDTPMNCKAHPTLKLTKITVIRKDGTREEINHG